MTKDCNGWNSLKQRLDARTHIPTFKQREIWWCSIGINVGHEQDGKGASYNRPVLGIVRKFNTRLFWGVPLTTKVKQSTHYHLFSFKERQQAAMLTQMLFLTKCQEALRVSIQFCISTTYHRALLSTLLIVRFYVTESTFPVVLLV